MTQYFKVIKKGKSCFAFWGFNCTMGLIPGREDLLEKEMAAHSSILAWEILWIEEPGRHDWAYAHTHGMTMTNVKILSGKWSDVKLKVSWLRRTELHDNDD